MYVMPAGMRLWSLGVMVFGIGVVRKCRSLGIHGGQAPEYFSVVEPADLEQFLAVRITAQQHDRRLRQLQRRSQQFLNRGIGLAVFRRRRHRELEATPLPAEHGIARGLRAYLVDEFNGSDMFANSANGHRSATPRLAP